MNKLGTSKKSYDPRVELRIISRVIPYMWPKGQPRFKWRVIIALSSLVLAKLVAVATPIILGSAVDTLAGNPNWLSQRFILGAVGLTLAYGISRFLESGFLQIRDVVFAKVGQRALRKVGFATFQHIHSLSLRYHLSRKTGGLSRVMERGVKGVAFLLRFMLFSIGPLLLQLLMITIALAAFYNAY